VNGYDEMDERLGALESELRQIKRALDEESEERWRVMGQLHSTLTEVRRVLRRLEEWQETTDGEVRRVTTSIRAAGGALMLPTRRS